MSNLEALMNARGLCALSLAELAGLGRGSVWRIINYKSDPKLSTVKKICSALNCTFEELTGGNND